MDLLTTSGVNIKKEGDDHIINCLFSFMVIGKTKLVIKLRKLRLLYQSREKTSYFEIVGE